MTYLIRFPTAAVQQEKLFRALITTFQRRQTHSRTLCATIQEILLTASRQEQELFLITYVQRKMQI